MVFQTVEHFQILFTAVF